MCAEKFAFANTPFRNFPLFRESFIRHARKRVYECFFRKLHLNTKIMRRLILAEIDGFVHTRRASRYFFILLCSLSRSILNLEEALCRAI